MYDAPPVVSVIMNCYNGSQHLEEAIKSVLNQTYEKWELVFWDNCSTDSSVSIVESFAEDDGRIKIHRADAHTSLGEARVHAIQLAVGEYLAFLDVDDFWYPRKLDSQMVLFSQGVGLVYSRMNILVQGDRQTNMSLSASKMYPKRKVLPQGDIVRDLIFDCFIGLPTAVIARSEYFKVGGIDSSLSVAEDYDIFLKVANTSQVRAVDEPLCCYRIHENNLSHSSVALTFSESIALIKSYSGAKGYLLASVFWRVRWIKAMFINKILLLKQFK